VLIGVPRLDGKMNASGLASLLMERRNSSSVSMEAGSHTEESLPSVLVSISIPSVTLLSMRRLLPSLSFQRRANISPGRRPSTRNNADDEPVAVAHVKQHLRYLLGREVGRRRALARFRNGQLAGGVLYQHFQLDRLIEDGIQVDANLGEHAL
jgi:hypothetical protein